MNVFRRIGYQSDVPIFTRILDIKRAVLARLRDKRRQPRHRVGAGFPLKASLNLIGSTAPELGQEPARGNGLDWSGVVGDISGNGLSILLSPAATTGRGETTILRLVLENHEIVIPCTVAHFRVYNSHAYCGVELEFDDFKAQKDYLQLVEAVKLGSSFVPAGAAHAEGTLVTKSWRSVGPALLTEWRDANTRTLDRFELNLGDHTVQGWKCRLGLEVHPSKHQTKSVSADTEGEVSQLFRWVVGNLPKHIPSDLRKLMSCSGGSPLPPPGPAAVATAKMAAVASSSTVIKVPASVWRAPKPAAPASV